MGKIVKILLCLYFIIAFKDAYCQSRFDSGYKEYMYGDLNKAVIILSNCIEDGEELANAYMYRGAAYIFLNKIESAEIDLNSSIKIDSLSEKIHFYFGKLHMVKGNYSLAIKKYSDAISINSLYASAYGERSGAKCMLEQFEEAIDDADLAISIDSTNQIFYTNRGYANVKLKNFETAIKDFDLSIKLEPNQKAYANKGLAYLYLNKHSLAVENFSKSLDFNPNDAEILFYRGTSYENLGIIDKACEDYKKSNSISNNKMCYESLLRLNCK